MIRRARVHLARASAVSAILALSLAPAASGEVRRPDLRIAFAVDAPSPFLAGAQFTTGASIVNAGRSRARASSTRYYLSRDETASSDDVVLATRLASRLRPGRVSFRAVRVEIPLATAPGSYWMIVCADATRRARESNEKNNCLTTAFPVEIVPRTG